MEPFRRAAHFAIVRDTSFIVLAAAALMLAFSYQLAVAFYIGASIALFFSVALVFKVGSLTEDTVQWSEPWLALERGLRPRGPDGRRLARDSLEELQLRFAKRSSGVAIVLYSSALGIGTV